MKNMDISGKIEKLRTRLTSVVDSDYFCLLCNDKLKEFIDSSGRLLKLYKYCNEKIQYCRNCLYKIQTAENELRDNGRLLDLNPKTDIDRASQLTILEAKELLQLVQCVESNPAEEKKYLNCYQKNIQALLDRFLYRQQLI